jgi:hypothetical protein
MQPEALTVGAPGSMVRNKKGFKYVLACVLARLLAHLLRLQARKGARDHHS